MATAQPMMPDDQPADDDTGMAQPKDDGSYCIEIRVGSDKQITVSVDRGAGGPDAGADMDDDAAEYDESDQADGVPCKSVKEALTLALEIYRANGEMPQAADEDFQQGFKGANA